jgi:hypothetical protein
MGVEVKFVVGGREITPDNVSDAARALVYKHIRASITERLRGVRCPLHGGSPQVTVDGGPDKLAWRITGCCERLRDEAQRPLNID